jgi:hypothetical protein
MAAHRFGILLALVAGLFCGAAHAADLWRIDGNPVGRGPGDQTHPVVSSDGQGGVYVLWQDPDGNLRAQHVDAAGRVVSGWPVGGASLLYGYDPAIVPDDRGGAFVAWRASEVVIGSAHLDFASAPASLVSSDELGADPDSPHAVAPAHIAKGPSSMYPVLVPADSGRALMVWTYDSWSRSTTIRVGRLDATGQHDTTWPWGTMMDSTVSIGQYLSAACADGDGGVFIGWLQYNANGNDIYAAHVLRDGSIASGWGPHGVPVCRASGVQDAIGIVPDGAGGALFAWQDARNGAFEQVFAQHLAANGTVSPGWPVDGFPVCGLPSMPGPGRSEYPAPMRQSSVASDGAGGLFVAFQLAFYDPGDIAVQHVLGDAPVAPGWPPNGLRVSAANGTQTLPVIAADGSGGAVVSWQDGRDGGNDVYAVRVRGDGTTAPGWPADGLRVSPSAGIQQRPVVACTGRAAIVAWQGPGCEGDDVFLSRFGLDGSAPTGVPDSSLTAMSRASDLARGRVTLTWDVTGTDDPTVVERRGPEQVWARLGYAPNDGGGSATFVDSTAFEGCSYAYRLGLVPCGASEPARWTGDVSITAPIGAGFAVPTSRLLFRDASLGAPHVQWQVAPAPLEGITIERSIASGAWESAATVEREANGLVDFTDGDTKPGTLYGYRLRFRTCGHDTWSVSAFMTTPGRPIAPHPGPAPVPLSVEAPVPNPVTGPVWISFALPHDGPAVLELFDAVGRLRARQDVGGYGHGVHAVMLGVSARLHGGTYWVRLTQDREARTARFTVLP